MAVANDAFAALGIDTIDTSAKMMDAYLTDPDAANTFDVAFVPTSYQWGGWDKPVAVGQTEMAKWQMAEEQPQGRTYLVGDSKTEHPAVDPDITRTRWFQNMTQEGGILGIELTRIVAQLAAADGALPDMLTGSVTRTLAAVDGALTLEVADKGIKHGGTGTHATWQDGRAQTVAPDGLMWIKGSDADVLIVDEDSGDALGERKFALVIDPDTMTLAEAGKGYFLAMAGGGRSPRAMAGATVMGGAIDKPRSSEFSGSWDITALLARKDDGSFYTIQELAGTAEQAMNASVPINRHTLICVVQHGTESGGQVKAVQADRGGQIFIFSLDLPASAFEAAGK